MDRLSVLTHSSRSARPGIASRGSGAAGGSSLSIESSTQKQQAQQQQQFVLDPSAEPPVDAFSFDQRHAAHADGAYSIIHHVFHKETSSFRRYYRGDVALFNLPFEDPSDVKTNGSRRGSVRDGKDNGNWYIAYTVSSSVVFR
jgi:hypothetical protein